MLIKQLLLEKYENVKFVNKDWGESDLAKRYGIKRYPAVFVNDLLVARPADFGFLGMKGKYTPWSNPKNHELFKKDLSHLIDIALAGAIESGDLPGAAEPSEAAPATLPAAGIVGLTGETIDLSAFTGKVTVIDFWGEWCKPCKPTLELLAGLKRRFGSELVVLAVAVQSDEGEVRKLADKLDKELLFALGTDEFAEQFGGILTVPTVFVFGRDGKRAAVFYGAPEDLHQKLEALLEKLLE